MVLMTFWDALKWQANILSRFDSIERQLEPSLLHTLAPELTISSTQSCCP